MDSSVKHLRQVARERCIAGRLPSAPPSWTWIGYGDGDICDLCNEPISTCELEYEIGVLVNGAVQHFRFHMACQGIWLLECASQKN